VAAHIDLSSRSISQEPLDVPHQLDVKTSEQREETRETADTKTMGQIRQPLDKGK
jgi:hypothetical protein